MKSTRPRLGSLRVRAAVPVPVPTAVLMAALVVALAGCGKVDSFKQAVVDKAAATVAEKAEQAIAIKQKDEADKVAAEAEKKAAFDKAVAAKVDQVMAAKAAAATTAADHAGGTAPNADAGAVAAAASADVAAPTDAGGAASAAQTDVGAALDPAHDVAALASVGAFATCSRVDRRRCSAFAALELRCKAAWRARRKEAKAYELLWRTLVHGLTTAEHHKSRYGAAFLVTSACQPTPELVADEALGRAVLKAVRLEGKPGGVAARMGQLLSAWWAPELPKLHAEIETFLGDKMHPVPDARAELVRASGVYAGKRPALARALLQVANTREDDVTVRAHAVRQLWRLTGGESADDAVATLARIATDRPSELTDEAYAALGDAAAVEMWPALVKHWRQLPNDPIVGAAMALATWRYAVATYPKAVDSVPVRVAAFDVALEVLSATAVPSGDRAAAIYGVQRGGHPNARAALERIVAAEDAVLAKAATKALKRVKSTDPELAKVVKPLVSAPPPRPGRPQQQQVDRASVRPSARPPAARAARPSPARPGR